MQKQVNFKQFDYTHNPYYNKSLGFFDYRPELAGKSNLEDQLLKGVF